MEEESEASQSVGAIIMMVFQHSSNPGKAFILNSSQQALRVFNLTSNFTDVHMLKCYVESVIRGEYEAGLKHLVVRYFSRQPLLKSTGCLDIM